MKKRTIIIGIFILFLVGVISIIGTYAIDSTITEGNSSTADYLFNITLGDRTNREVVIPSYDSKIVDIKISNPNEFAMSYLLYIEGVNPNISVINIKDTESKGVLASKTVAIIQIFIQNNSNSDITLKIKDIVGFEKETLTLPDNSTSITKGNYYKVIVKSNNNTYGKVKPNIKLSTLNGIVKYEIVPNTGYKYKSTTCNGNISNNILTISNITSNVNCEVVFEPKTITVSLDGNMFSTSSNSITSNGLTITYDPALSYLTINGTPTSNVNLNYLMGLTFTEGDKYNTKLTYISGNVTNNGTGGGMFVVDVINSSKAIISTRNYRNTALANEDTNSTLTVNSAGASDGAGFMYWIWFATPADWIFTDYKIKVDITKDESEMVSFGSTYGTMSTPKRSGYTFMGWYTGENGTGTKISEDTVVSATSNHTLYAHWEANTYKVNFYNNADYLYSKDSVIVVLNGRTFYKKNDGATLVGYAYNGTWSGPVLVGTTADSVAYYTSYDSTVLTYGGTFIYNGITYYYSSGEYWVSGNSSDTSNLGRKKYTVTETGDAKASTAARKLLEENVSTVSQSFVYGVSQKLTVNSYKKSGYEFAGWSTTPLGEIVYTDNENVINLTTENNATINLYAHWTEPKKYTTSGSYTFTAPNDGLYKIELWGAQGGGTSSLPGGYGGYTSGIIKLSKNDNLYVYVGEHYDGYKNSYCFNGGGSGSYSTKESTVNYNGGGATDVRYFGTYQPTEADLTWNSTIGLNSRIMIAGGGGGYTSWTSGAKGGNAGGLIGGSGNRIGSVINSTGGTQISGGNSTSNTSTTPYAGVFGIGGYGNYSGDYRYYAGGGGGYYGGGSGGFISGSVGSAAGGSSYISGHTGCVAITSSSSRSPKTDSSGASCSTGTNDNLCSIHYSNKNFIDTVMIDGSGYAWTNTKGSLQQMPKPSGGYYASGQGNTGDGAVRITYLGKDTGAPVGTLTASKDYNTINVNVNATDDIGIDHYEYYLSTSATCPSNGYTISNNNNYTYNITSTGTYYVCARVVDKVGNILSLKSNAISYPRIYSATIRYNTNGGTITPNTSSYTWTTDDTGLIYQNGNIYEQVIRYETPADLANYNNSNFINITPPDDLNVVSGSEWICLSGCSVANRKFNQETKYSTSDFCDVTDNNCTVVLGLNLIGDINAPTCTLSANASTITASASDTGGSGLAYNGWSSSYSGSNSTSKSIATGTHTYYVKDGAGNTNSCSITIAGTTTNYTKTTQTCNVTSVGCSKAATASASGSCTCKTAGSATYAGTCSVSGGTASCSCGSNAVTNTCSVSYSCSRGVRQGRYCYLGEQSSCPSGWGTYKYNYGFTSSTSSVTSCSVGSSFTCDSSHSGSSYVSACTVSSYTCPSGYTKINNSYCYK